MDNTLKKYRYWEWRTIIVLFVGYALFYFVRKNLGMAIPAMEAELGISKTQLGIFLTIHSIIYGFSRFANGLLVDRFSKKKIMVLGLILTCTVNLLGINIRQFAVEVGAGMHRHYNLFEGGVSCALAKTVYGALNLSGAATDAR
jgi:sugar phosphate permease